MGNQDTAWHKRRELIIPILIGVIGTLIPVVLPMNWYVMGVCCLAVAICIVWLVVIIFPSSLRFTKWHKAVIIGAIILVSVGGFYRVKEQWVKDSRTSFSVSLVGGTAGGPFFAFKSGNDNLYFIDVLICVDVVNKTTVLSKLSDYYAQVMLGGKWVPLQHIPEVVEGGQFYWVFGDIYNGKSIDFIQKTLDEQISNTGLNLEPGQTITGLLIFYLKNEDRKRFNKTKPLIIKLTTIDSVRQKEEHILTFTDGNCAEEEGSCLNLLGFKVKKMDINLRAFHIVNDY